jgi:hypothetical protein
MGDIGGRYGGRDPLRVQTRRSRRLVGCARVAVCTAPAAPATLFAWSPATSIVLVLHEMSLGGHVTVSLFVGLDGPGLADVSTLQLWMGFDAGDQG